MKRLLLLLFTAVLLPSACAPNPLTQISSGRCSPRPRHCVPRRRSSSSVPTAAQRCSAGQQRPDLLGQ